MHARLIRGRGRSADRFALQDALCAHVTAGAQHAFNANWNLAVDWTHEQGVHSYARYQYQAGYTLFSPLFAVSDAADQMNYVPNLSVFRSDNRSRYDGMMVHLQGNVTSRFNLVANYTLSRPRRGDVFWASFLIMWMACAIPGTLLAKVILGRQGRMLRIDLFWPEPSICRPNSRLLCSANLKAPAPSP